MLNNEQEEKLVQILIDRINALNEDILTIIGHRIKQIGELTPTQVHQIQQMLMYNTDINSSCLGKPIAAKTKSGFDSSILLATVFRSSLK